MRIITKSIIALIISLFIFYFIIRETGLTAVWESLSLFFDRRGLSILIITVIINLIGAARWRGVLTSVGEKVPFKTVFKYHIQGFTVDYLTPFAFLGGEAVRIFLMEKEVGLKKSAFSSITDKIMGISAHFLFMVVGLLFFVIYGTAQHSIFIFYVSVAVSVIFLLLFLFYFQALRKKSFIGLISFFYQPVKSFFKNNSKGKVLIEIERDIITFFSSSPKNFLKGMGISMVLNFFYALRVFLIIYYLTGSFEVLISIFIYGLVILSMALPLPASIGGMEAIMGLAFGLIGFSFSYGVMMALVLRSADIVICITGGVLFLKMSAGTFFKEIRGFFKNGS